jgi:hypothetical protein
VAEPAALVTPQLLPCDELWVIRAA